MLVGGDFTTVQRRSPTRAYGASAWAGARPGGLERFLDAAREIAEHGTFANLGRAIPYAPINDASSKGRMAGRTMGAVLMGSLLGGAIASGMEY